MARNQEKAQSILFRFREQQSAELGFSSRSDRRPRMASSVTDLRTAEKWRSEVMREISKKVSKIQDENLSDYEVRDLNDEINKLLRTKNHWETQIINLGGANYKRAAKFIDSSGKEVAGSRGYKYFGRARELPGVKELFAAKEREDADMEQIRRLQATTSKQMGPEYYGDFDEVDEKILELEREAQINGWKKLAGPDLPIPKELSTKYQPILPPTLLAERQAQSIVKEVQSSPSKRKKASKKTEDSRDAAEPAVAFPIEIKEPVLPTVEEIDARVNQLKKELEVT